MLLLDGKIESWKVANYPKSTSGEFKAFWKCDRLGDYNAKTNCWTVSNPQENHEVFQKLAPEWFAQWKHADDYSGFRAYNEINKIEGEMIKR